MLPHLHQAESFSTHLAFKTLRFPRECAVLTLQRVLQQSSILSLILQLARSVGGINFSGGSLNRVQTSLGVLAFEEGVPMTLLELTSMA